MSSRPLRSAGILSPRPGLLAPVPLGLLGLFGLTGLLAAGSSALGHGSGTDNINASPVFVTQLGGKSSELATSVVMDVEGAIFVAGWTRSSDFPTTREVVDRKVDNRDAFVSKFSPDGTQLIWSTVLGGGRDEEALTLVVDDAGVILVGGWTASDDYPTTALAHRRERVGRKDGFLTALDPNAGHILFSTFVGGSGDDAVTGIALAPDGDLTLTGWTESRDLPTLEYSLQARRGGGRDAFVIRLDGVASLMRYATYLGGRGHDAAVGLFYDDEGYLTVAGTTESSDFPVTSGAHDQTRNGSDVFVTRLTPEGGRLAFSTFFGGNRDEVAHGVTLGPDGGALVVGMTRSDNLDVRGGAGSTRAGRRDGFVLHLSNSGGALIFARYLGGSGDDFLAGVALDSLGGVWVGGKTESDDLPVSASAVQTTRGGAGDSFLTHLDAYTGLSDYTTYVGGAGDEEVWALAPDYTHGGVAFVGRAQRTDRSTRGQFAGSGGASDVLIGRFLPGACSVPAQVLPLGGLTAPSLDATLPHLGKTMLVSLSEAETTTRGLFFLGAPSGVPLVVEGMGTLFLDPIDAVPIGAFTTDQVGQASLSLTIPDSTDLCGLHVVIQALVNGKATNAVELVLGS